MSTRTLRPARSDGVSPRSLSATELLKKLVRSHSAIERVLLKVYTPYTGASQRLALRVSRDVEDMTGDELLTRALDATRLVRELLRHDPEKERAIFEVDARELLEKRDLPVRCGQGQVVGICSRCLLRDGRAAHFPLMDFRITPGPRSLACAKRALRAIGESRGTLLVSGRSYHYYGQRLLEEESWRRFMEHAILLAPLTDTRYIGHRLLAGTAVLRLTATELKPQIPYVVASL